uniref:Protein phosphatase inhibitor 2 n=1 Tax=Ascaris lumbricoides TaxID=6252 RepID=A0A0M3IEE1_ASCLU
MADYEVSSKGHEGDDERSVTTSQDSKSALPDVPSPPSERSTHDSDEHRRQTEAIKPSEKRPSKGGKVVAALRNERHDQLINEYEKYFPKPESTDDEMSIRSLQQDNESSISKQIAPLRSPEHDLVIDEFKKHFATEDHHSDSEKTISESSRSDEEDEERGAMRVVSN